MEDTYSIVAFQALVLGLLLFLSHRLRRRHAELVRLAGADLQAKLDWHFRQVEDLFSLYYDLRPHTALPATRAWAASPDMLRQLREHIVKHPPNVVVECSSGVSTVVIARTLQQLRAGHVFSLEHDKKYADRTRALLSCQELSEWATVVDAPLSEHQIGNSTWNWYDVNELTSLLRGRGIDLILVDGPPFNIQEDARYPAGPLLFPLLVDGGAVYVDDAKRTPEQRICRRWSAEFRAMELEMIDTEKGLALLTARQHSF